MSHHGKSQGTSWKALSARRSYTSETTRTEARTFPRKADTPQKAHCRGSILDAQGAFHVGVPREPRPRSGPARGGAAGCAHSWPGIEGARCHPVSPRAVTPVTYTRLQTGRAAQEAEEGGFSKARLGEKPDLPGARIPPVVGRTGRVDALVAPSRVEAHAVRPTAHILLQTLVHIWHRGHRSQDAVRTGRQSGGGDIRVPAGAGRLPGPDSAAAPKLPRPPRGILTPEALVPRLP